TGAADSSADDDLLDVVGQDELMSHVGDRGRGRVHEAPRELVAVLGRREDVGGAGGRSRCAFAGGEGGGFAGLDRGVRRAGEAGTAGNRLEAAAQPAGARGAVGVEDDVADLAGEPADTAVQPAVEDHTGRDAGPDAEIDQVVDAAVPGVAMEADG